MIDPEKIRWASVEEIEPSNNLPNKKEPPAEFKKSGEKKNQPLPRQWLNYQFDQYYQMFVDVQDQIDGIKTSATGTFTTADAKTVTVVDGIITSIV